MILPARVYKLLKYIGLSAVLSLVTVYSAAVLAQQPPVQGDGAPLRLAKADTAKDQELPTAVVWYLQMAKKGDADAQYNLGSVYETGFGVKRDLDEAVRWYKKAAANDHQLAQLKLGILYVLGEGTRQSLIKGTSWIQSAADNGNKFAAELYNKVLAPDIILEMSAEEVVKKVKPFIDLGEKKSIAKLNTILKKAEKKAKKKQPELAQRFTGKSKNTLGKEVDIKNDVPAFLDKKNQQRFNLRNSNLALLQREANAGNPEAQYELGRLYDTGEKLDRDRRKAITWYTSAANQGHAESQYKLAIAYLFGIGTKKNTALAEKWLSAAAKQNHPIAKELLPIYKANHSQNTTISIAVAWYLEKIADDDPEGEFELGHMYEKGWGIRPNNAAARKWYIDARSKDSGGAARRLRQIKASQAADDPDPPPDSRPQMPEEEKTRSQTTTTVSSPARKVADTRSANSEASAGSSSGVGISGSGDNESVFERTLLESVSRRSVLTPVILILFGLVMGITVFKWMRRGNYKKSVF